MATAVVLTISDTRSKGTAEDLSGPAVEEMLTRMGIETADRRVVPDEIEAIRGEIRRSVNRVSLIVTTGGTGIATRDVTPEAVAPLLDKSLPGFGEIMRTGGYAKTPLSIISRGGAGLAGRTLIVMLPGSPRGVRDSLDLLGPAILHVLKFLENQPVDCERESRRDV